MDVTHSDSLMLKRRAFQRWQASQHCNGKVINRIMSKDVWNTLLLAESGSQAIKEKLTNTDRHKTSGLAEELDGGTRGWHASS